MKLVQHNIYIGVIALVILIIGVLFLGRLESPVLEYISPSLGLTNTVLLLIAVGILINIRARLK